MEGLIIGFIVGYLVRFFIAIFFDEWQTNKEFRKAKIEVDLDKCCENAYNHGYEVGRLKGRAEEYERFKREGFPHREKGTE